MDESIIKGKELNRITLNESFENGMRPSAKDFKNLIESTINKLDDGISKSFKHGLKLSPEGSKDKNTLEEEPRSVISFYERIDSVEPSWVFSLAGQGEDKHLCIASGKSEKVLLTLASDGKIGVMNEDPKANLDVKGMLRVTSRVGSYEDGIVPANNQWHTITNVDIEGCKMFEVAAIAYGNRGEGKYATLHAIASNAYSGKRGRVHCSRDYYSWRWWQRIKLRWIGTSFGYKLQIKTCSNYGNDGEIQYSITQIGKDITFKKDQIKPEIDSDIYSER